MSVWGGAKTQFFYELTPEVILSSVEQALEKVCTGRCMALNSMENRVYEVEIDGENFDHPWEKFVIAKYYRPGRWSQEQILEEHQFLADLEAADIPVVAPLKFTNGKTLNELDGKGIYYAIFPKISGRAPMELATQSLEQVGRLIARMHGVGATKKMQHRMVLNPESYGQQNLDFLCQEVLKGEVKDRYYGIAQKVVDAAMEKFSNISLQRIHGDAHLGNLLWNQQGPFWVDFDDCLTGPPVQDLWLIAGGRDEFARSAMSSLLKGYEMMYPFDRRSLQLIEILRALRMIHFSSWIGRRYADPAFSRAFADYGSDSYWNRQIADLQEQLSLVNDPTVWHVVEDSY